MSCLAGGGSSPAGARHAEQLFHADAQGLGDGDQLVGARQLPAPLPIADVGVRLADLPGELAHRQAGLLPHLPQIGRGFHEHRILGG